MSIKRISSIWDQSKSKGNDRLLMLALADAANDAGYCWPGYDNLQQKMACKSRGSVTNAIKRQEAIGELYVDHRQQRGNRYLVLVGLTDEEIKAGLILHFDMDESDAQETIRTITEKRNKSKKQTNAKSLKNRPQKVRKIDRISLKNRLDPSIPVIEPSCDAPTEVESDGIDMHPITRTPFQLVQDAIVELWFKGNKAMYGRAGLLAQVCCGTATKKGYAEYNINPPIDAVELVQFSSAYLADKPHGFNLPESPEALNKEVYNWRAKTKLTRVPAPSMSASPTLALEKSMYGGES